MGKTKLAILISSIAIIVLVVASVTAYAFWGGNPSLTIPDENSANIDNTTNVTYKYMVFAPNGTYTKDYRLFFDEDTQKFKLYEISTDGSSKGLSSDIITYTNVALIGYIGSLGEYEKAIIPESITVGDSSFSVTKINLYMTEYDDLKNITKVSVPSAVTSIEGASFSGCGNLSEVYFENETSLPTISKWSFIGVNGSIKYYQKSGDTYTELGGISKLEE